MSQEEREFFLLGGHVLNELCTLNKIFLWTLPKKIGCEIQEHANGYQSLTIAKIYAGKLREAWGAFQVAYFHNALSKKYDERLEGKAAEALGRLKRYFGTKGNLLHNARNNYAFHYSPSEIEQHWGEAAGQEGFEIFIGPEDGNNFFQAAEISANIAMASSFGADNLEEAFELFLQQVDKVARWFQDFAQGVMTEMLQDYVPEFGAGGESVEIDVAGDLDDIHIPYFVNIQSQEA